MALIFLKILCNAHSPYNKALKFQKKKNTNCTPSHAYPNLHIHSVAHMLKIS